MPPTETRAEWDARQVEVDRYGGHTAACHYGRQEHDRAECDCRCDDPHGTVETLIAAAAAWASPDDWNVPSLYVSTLRKLAEWIEKGVPVAAIIAHAKHVRRQCDVAGCEAWASETAHRDSGHGEQTGVCLRRPCPEHSR